MSLLDILFREKGSSLSSSGYSHQGVADGGKKWGFAHHDKQAIEIPTVRTIQTVAAAKTLAATDTGKFFLVDGAVTITLPTASASLKGVWAEFIMLQDETLTITGETADQIVAANNASADSVAFSTTTEQIGSGARVLCDGSRWIVMPILGSETVTPTVSDT